MIDDPSVRERLATMRINNEVAKLLAYRTSFVAATGGLPGVEGSMHKLFYAESMTADAAELVDMLGAEGVLQRGEDECPGRRMGRAPLPARGGDHHLRGDQRDAALDHRRAGARPPEIGPLSPILQRLVGPAAVNPVRSAAQSTVPDAGQCQGSERFSGFEIIDREACMGTGNCRMSRGARQVSDLDEAGVAKVSGNLADEEIRPAFGISCPPGRSGSMSIAADDHTLRHSSGVISARRSGR